MEVVRKSLSLCFALQPQEKILIQAASTPETLPTKEFSYPETTIQIPLPPPRKFSGISNLELTILRAIIDNIWNLEPYNSPSRMLLAPEKMDGNYTDCVPSNDPTKETFYWRSRDRYPLHAIAVSKQNHSNTIAALEDVASALVKHSMFDINLEFKNDGGKGVEVFNFNGTSKIFYDGSPIYFAAYAGNLAACIFLLNHKFLTRTDGYATVGVDNDCTNVQKWSLLECADASGNDEVIEFLHVYCG
jgi:hypothetical protein